VLFAGVGVVYEVTSIIDAAPSIIFGAQLRDSMSSPSVLPAPERTDSTSIVINDVTTRFYALRDTEPPAEYVRDLIA
jgi:hypothetical protein